MMRNRDNPFRITKSNDLTDEEIDQLWVASGDEGEADMARPRSPMAMFILGGKGSGKSHLMRYHSFSVQAIRNQRKQLTVAQGVEADGYLGVYARCNGLDASRFTGKSVSDDRWDALFAYYFEIWIADRTIAILRHLAACGAVDAAAEARMAQGIAALFDDDVSFLSLLDVANHLTKLRRFLDMEINNAAFSRRVDARITVSRGRLFFGIPSVVTSSAECLSSIMVTYLLDEFENFSEPQQVYINTLIREKEGPVTFKVGARLYGIRTRRTLSGGERNLQGSEYEELRLDERARSDPRTYRRFALRLVERRLESEFAKLGNSPSPERLLGLFEEPETDWRSSYYNALFSGSGPDHRIHLRRFREKLKRGIADGWAQGVTERQVDELVGKVSFPDYPVVEKLCILNIYQRWFRNGYLFDEALRVNAEGTALIEGRPSAQFKEFVTKHKGDMIAQLLRETDKKQIYAGLDSFIRMSEGLPRTLITILKHVYDWSIYTENRPALSALISIRAQQRGVIEATEWFLDHMLPEGDDASNVRTAIQRLAELFRINRFADKPIETSLVAFSVDDSRMDPEPARILQLALNTSLLVNVPRGQRERNSEQVTKKIELNTMLSPRWDLPISRRGVATFSVDEANCIFSPARERDFLELARSWESKMTAPSFGRAETGATLPSEQQSDLFQ